MAVRSITTEEEFRQLIVESASNNQALTVIDFTATWCGPCQVIKPVFASLAAKYQNEGVVCVTVDVDQLQGVAQAMGVTAMPTFLFFKAANKVAELKGANPQQLEALMVQHKGTSASSGASSAAAGPVPGHSNLAEFMTLNQVECLNQSTSSNIKAVFNGAGAGHVESDCDEQLIFSIPFNQNVKLHSIQITPSASMDQAPKTIKTFINLPHTPSFEEAESAVAVETLTLTANDFKQGAVIPLRFVKYQSVHSIQIFVVDNQGGGDVTALKSLALYGSPVETTKMGDLKKMGHDH